MINMGTIKGKNSRNTSKYDFYITYSVDSDPKNLRYEVTVSAMLDIVRWRFDSRLPETVTISIDGSKSSKQYPNGMDNWGNNSSRVSKTMYTYKKYIPYTATAQTIKLTAKTTDIESGGYGPGTCSASGSIKLAAKFSTAGKLTAGSATESSLKATLSGIPAKVGFERVIDWYYKIGTASSYTKFKETKVAGSSKTTSFSVSKAGLISSRPYNFKAVIRTGKKTITTKTATGTTSATTLKSTLSMGNTYGKFAVTIKGNIGFAREISWYYKKVNEKVYVLSSTTKISAGATATSYAKTFSGLLSNVRYNFKAVLKTGNTLLKQIEVTGLTVRDESLVPVPVLYRVDQKIGSKELYVYWDSPENVNGTVYAVQYRRNGDVNWSTAANVVPFDGGSIIQIVGGNEEFEFRISATNSIAVGVVRYSEVIVSYVYDDFEWDTEKRKGEPFLLTVKEWNRLVEWVQAMFLKAGLDIGDYNMRYVQNGEAVTAECYNSAAGAINELAKTTVPVTAQGNGITADSLNMLKDSLNKRK